MYLRLKTALRPVVDRSPLLLGMLRRWQRWRFEGTPAYWESRYRSGDTSGDGSYGALAHFKAEVLNEFVKRHSIRSVIEFGCGDGSQLALAQYPPYLGMDVSSTAVKMCKSRFVGDTSKKFMLYDPYRFATDPVKAELALSLDVMYHLVEDELFYLYVDHLFRCASRFVIVYSADAELKHLHPAPHVRYRNVTQLIAERVSGWQLIQTIKNRYPYDATTDTGSLADFFIYATG